MSKIVLIFLVIVLIIILVVMSIVLRLIYIDNPNVSTYDLKNDGICVIPHIFTSYEVHKIKKYIIENKTLVAKEYIMKSEKMRKKISQILGPGYRFHDYIFSIKKSQVHTCHRDYNGDLFNVDQKHPSYTIIIYLEDMKKCLDVIPKSHTSLYKNAVNFTDVTETVLCKPGDAALFNANLIHTGTINDREENMRIQMKISHIDDHSTLGFYQNYNKELNKVNVQPEWVKNMQKHISCQFPILGTLTQSVDYNTVSRPEPSFWGFFNTQFAKLFYGDAEFYTLDNAT